jgi:hypothetical protein
VRGKVYAIDGSGLGNDFRLVALLCVSATRPIIVAWRLLAWLKFGKGIDTLVSLPEDRLLYQDLRGLAAELPRAEVAYPLLR